MNYVTGNNNNLTTIAILSPKEADCTKINNYILQTVIPESSGTYYNIDIINYPTMIIRVNGFYIAGFLTS